MMQSEMVEVPQDMLLWATLYALPRNSYLPAHVAAQIVINWQNLTEEFRKNLAREIYVACMYGTVPNDQLPYWRQVYQLVPQEDIIFIDAPWPTLDKPMATE